MAEAQTRVAPMHSSGQLGVQCDLGIEDLGDRAVLLGVAGHPGECGFVQVRHDGAQSQSRASDAEMPCFIEAVSLNRSAPAISVAITGRYSF